MHRQIGGYPFALSPAARNQQNANMPTRYVTFSGEQSTVSLVGFTRHAPSNRDEANDEEKPSAEKPPAKDGGKSDDTGDDSGKRM
jgi:hypothetical protein